MYELCVIFLLLFFYIVTFITNLFVYSQCLVVINKYKGKFQVSTPATPEGDLTLFIVTNPELAAHTCNY